MIIADDHPVVLKGLKEIITESFDNVTIEEAVTGYEFMGKVLSNDFDVALLDVSLPDINGLEALKEVRKKKPKLPVLVISIYPEDQYAVRAMKAGAWGYVTKRTASTELVGAIRKLLSGRRYVSPNFAEQMVLDLETDAEKRPHEKLSERELQVLKVIGKGKSVKEIAEELHLSANTVRTYRARILEKIGVKGTTGLIHYAITQRLVE
jgi:DNA-binding NarL/FixJ family response regulator